MSGVPLRCGMLVFPNLTQLDLTGPYEVLARLPGAETLLLWKDLEPVRSEHGLTILPMATLSECPPLDLVLVPGGPGINPLLEDEEVLAFVRRAAPARLCRRRLHRLPGAGSGRFAARKARRHALDVAPAAARFWRRAGGRARGPRRQSLYRRRRHRRHRRGAAWREIAGPPANQLATPTPAVLAAVLARAEWRQRDRAERVARAAAALG